MEKNRVIHLRLSSDTLERLEEARKKASKLAGGAEITVSAFVRKVVELGLKVWKARQGDNK